MEKLKIWLKNNWGTALLVVGFLILFVNPNAKAWLMRQMISTGIMNSKIQEKQETVAAEIPEPAEEMRVQDETGKKISTLDLNGKVVFINFWASWCPPCRAEFPSIQKFYDKYKNNKDLVFLTINLDDDPSLGKKYLQTEQFGVPFLVPAGEIPSKYFSGSLPTTVVLDKTGSIRLMHAGMADYSKASFFQEIDGLLSE